MKQYKYFFIIIALFYNFLNAQDLPKNAFNFMHLVFPDFKINNISLEDDIYKVTLENEAIISFNGYGDWIKIDSSFEPIPQEVLPKKILNSISKNFKNPRLIHVNKYDNAYEIMLYGVILYDKYDRFAIYIKEDGKIMKIVN